VIRNSLFISATALILVLFGLMSRLNFLAHRRRHSSHCGASIAVFIGILGLNLFAAALAINRKILLKDTGRKLSHFDNQMQAESPKVSHRSWRRAVAMARWDMLNRDNVRDAEPSPANESRPHDTNGTSPSVGRGPTESSPTTTPKDPRGSAKLHQSCVRRVRGRTSDAPHHRHKRIEPNRERLRRETFDVARMAAF